MFKDFLYRFFRKFFSSKPLAEQCTDFLRFCNSLPSILAISELFTYHNRHSENLLASLVDNSKSLGKHSSNSIATKYLILGSKQ